LNIELPPLQVARQILPTCPIKKGMGVKKELMRRYTKDADSALAGCAKAGRAVGYGRPGYFVLMVPSF
jgi:hypothetical protein